jgi:hypothetical protein
MAYHAHIDLDSHFDAMFHREEQASYYMDEVDAVISELDLPPDIDYLDAINRGEEELRRRQWAARSDYECYQENARYGY